MFRPTYIANRVIVALLLIVGVIAPWAVGARNLEGEFLLKEIRALKLKACHTYENDATALSAHERGLMHGLVALG